MRSRSEISAVCSGRLWFASLTLLRELERAFFSHWDKTVEAFEEEEVHDLRVASRRLREAVALFSPCFPAGALRRGAKLIREATKAMGALRNLDEALPFFSGLAPECPGCAMEIRALLSLLAEERKEALAELEKELSPAARNKAHRTLKRGRSRIRPFTPAAADPFTPFAAFAASALSERAEAIFALLPQAAVETDIAAQHGLRIAVKKMRYRTEIAAPLMKDGAEELLEALKKYQEILGKLHDVDVFAGMVRERLPEGDGREELLRVMRARREELFAAFTAATRDLPLFPPVRRTVDALRDRQAP